MRPIHRPGERIKMGFSGYTEVAAIKQQALSDSAYAAGYGFDGCRAPTPGAALPAEAVQERLTHVAEGWAYEAKLREAATRSGFDPRVHLPPMAQYQLAERLMPYPQTDRPWDRPTPGAIAIEPYVPDAC